MINKNLREQLKEHTVFDVVDAMVKEQMLNEYNAEGVKEYIDIKFME